MNHLARGRKRAAMGLSAVLVLACTVPEEGPKESLYDQGDRLHQGPEAYMAAQEVLSGLETREVRHDWMDLEALKMETRCRLGFFLSPDSEVPDGFVVGPAETCDDLSATDQRKGMRARWLQEILPFASDLAAQQARAAFARNYAGTSRLLAIEAEEWDVPNELDSCIEERLEELAAHRQKVTGLACEGYRSPSTLEIDHLREQLLAVQQQGQQRLDDMTRVAPVVAESFWSVEGVDGRKERDIARLPFSTTVMVEGRVGLPVTLMRGEQFTARASLESGSVALRLWKGDGSYVVATSYAMEGWNRTASVTWSPAETETYVVVVSTYDEALTVQLDLHTDGSGGLSEPERLELERLVKRASELSEDSEDSSAVLEIMHWNNMPAHGACLEAALFSYPAYAQNQVVGDALTECAAELRHRIETRSEVLRLMEDPEQD